MRSGFLGARCWPRSARRSWTSTARSSIAGVRYRMGMAARGATSSSDRHSGGCAGRVAKLDPRERGDAQQPSVDAVGPRLVVGALPESGLGRLVDQPGGRRPGHGCLRPSAPCVRHHVGIVDLGEDAGRALEIGDGDGGTGTGFGGQCPPQVLVAGEAEALGIGVDWRRSRIRVGRG